MIKPYIKWPQEYIFGDLMLQYNLDKAHNECIDIPFQIVSWCGCNDLSAMWNEEDTEIKVLLEGTVIFEGIRHCIFAPQEDGYVNYLDIKNLSRCLDKLHELCLEYCHSYDGE